MIFVKALPFVIKVVRFELRLASSEESFQFDCFAEAAIDPSPTIVVEEPGSTAKSTAFVQRLVSASFPHFEGLKTTKAKTSFGPNSVLTAPTIMMDVVGISSIIIIDFLDFNFKLHWLHLKTSDFGASE
jgi:hypothetical protein